MSIDSYESLFRKSIKEPFVFQNIQLKKILCIIDLPSEEKANYQEKLKELLSNLNEAPIPEIDIQNPSDFNSVNELLKYVEEANPGLIITTRHIMGLDKSLHFSLGVCLEWYLLKAISKY